MRNNIVIISLSGNLYGSEQVFLDYLLGTKCEGIVFVPEGRLLDKIKVLRIRRHEFRIYNGIIHLYSQLLWLLLFGNIRSIYYNEGGHIRYANILARIFRNRKIYLHLRINEDINSLRIPKKKPINLGYVVISNFLSSRLFYEHEVVFDPYLFKFSRENEFNKNKLSDFPCSHFKIGLVGRVCKSKGVEKLIDLTHYLNNFGDFSMAIYVFGDLGDDLTSEQRDFFKSKNDCLKLEGFIDDNSSIYKNIDMILHLAEFEPLGRIFFESIDFEVPFLGYNSGGIGEIGALIGYNEHFIRTENSTRDIYLRLIEMRNNLSNHKASMKTAKKVAYSIYGIEKYVNKIDNLLLS